MAKPVLSRATVRLDHRPGQMPPWQWHAREPWTCPYFDRPESYLSGFPSEGEARRYGRRMGWCG